MFLGQIFRFDLPILDVSNALENGNLTLSARSSLESIFTKMEPEHQKHPDTRIFVEPSIIISRILIQTTLRCGLNNGSEYTGKHYAVPIRQAKFLNPARFLYPNSTDSDELFTIEAIGSWYGEPPVVDDKGIIACEWGFGSVIIVFCLVYLLARVLVWRPVAPFSELVYIVMQLCIYAALSGILGLGVESASKGYSKNQTPFVLVTLACEILMGAGFVYHVTRLPRRPLRLMMDLEAGNAGAPPVEIVNTSDLSEDKQT